MSLSLSLRFVAILPFREIKHDRVAESSFLLSHLYAYKEYYQKIKKKNAPYLTTNGTSLLSSFSLFNKLHLKTRAYKLKKSFETCTIDIIDCIFQL